MENFMEDQSLDKASANLTETTSALSKTKEDANNRTLEVSQTSPDSSHDIVGESVITRLNETLEDLDDIAKPVTRSKSSAISSPRLMDSSLQFSRRSAKAYSSGYYEPLSYAGSARQRYGAFRNV